MIDNSELRPPIVPESAPATSQGLPISTALILTILCALIVVGGSYGILKGTISTAAKASLSIITLIAVIGLAFAGIQLILALIATTGERRWFARQVGERRSGDRARKPKK
jgi:TRAP-type C4-dicarboxylate transport system permease small subunit